MIYALLSKPIPSPNGSPGTGVLDPGAAHGFEKVAVAIIIVAVAAIIIGALSSGKGPKK